VRRVVVAKSASKTVEGTAMSEALAMLRRTGVKVTWNELIFALTDAVQRMVDAQRVADAPYRLTPLERATLRDAGFDLETSSFGLDDAVTRTAIEYTALLTTSLSVSQAARLLRVDDSRIRQRLAARALYGLKVGHAWRLPAFQFEGTQVIPGVEKIFPHLSSDLHPIAVYTWFTSADPDLVVEDSSVNPMDENRRPPLSPRDWLRSGGNADVVAGIAASL